VPSGSVIVSACVESASLGPEGVASAVTDGEAACAPTTEKAIASTVATVRTNMVRVRDMWEGYRTVGSGSPTVLLGNSSCES